MSTDPATGPIAILYQAVEPPVYGGARKAPKPGGYSDSGADIGFALARGGFSVVTPVQTPDPKSPLDWVFPDTDEGLAEATERGATVLWANTVLFPGHPIERYLGRCEVVGQIPQLQAAADDKYETNNRLRVLGLPVAKALMIDMSLKGKNAYVEAEVIERLANEALLQLPIVVKPVRGRGSQGVTLAHDWASVARGVQAMPALGFGTQCMLEEFLPGQEITISVLPALSEQSQPRTLPPIARSHHRDEIAPYNGLVPVSQNSTPLAPEQTASREVRAAMRACQDAFSLLGAKCLIRIDCRQDRGGKYQMFDINFKPNMTGPGRPGRAKEASLTLIAAHAAGMDQIGLLMDMLATRWQCP